MALNFKKIRKGFAFCLALIMLLSVNIIAYADERAEYNLTLTLTAEDTFDVTGLLYDDDKTAAVTLRTDNEAVAVTLDGNMIKAVSAGTATITAECADYYMTDYIKSVYYIALTVVNKEPEQPTTPTEPKTETKSYDDVLPYCKGIAKMADKRTNLKRVVYGKSVMGKPLEAYEIYNASKNNKYSKTLFMDFCVHGFEDEYYRDGKVLLKEAVRLVKYFTEHSSALKNFRLVIVVCANPDGTFDGKNNSRANSRAFGRCTAKHVDINRDFRKFKGKETRALKKYILKSDPDIYMNCHGWENQVIGTRKLNKIVKKNLRVRRTQNGVYCYNKGFAIGWVHKKLQIPVALVEYKNTSSVSTTKDVKMIKDIVKAY